MLDFAVKDLMITVLPEGISAGDCDDGNGGRTTCEESAPPCEDRTTCDESAPPCDDRTTCDESAPPCDDRTACTEGSFVGADDTDFRALSVELEKLLGV